MNMKYDFSLIIPVFNTELYIGKCLKSIDNQTYSNYEVIIINDGSNDSSIDICNQYMKKISNMIILNQENRGLSFSRNRALNICKGKYIWFVDSDDFLHDSAALENIYRALENDELDILQFNAKFKVSTINEWSQTKNKSLLLNNLQKTEVLTGREYLDLVVSYNEWRYGVWMFVFRKEFLLENDLKFEENFIHEDVAFNIKCLIVCDRIKYMDRCYYTYRIRPNSIMGITTTIANIEGYLQAYRSIEKTFSRYNYFSRYYLQIIYLQIVERFFYLRHSDLIKPYFGELESLGQSYMEEFNSVNLIMEAKLTNEKKYNNFLKVYDLEL